MNARTLNERLFSQLENDHLAHAYLLEGPRALTEPVARRFGMAALCTGEGKKPCGTCPSCRNLANGIMEDLLFLEGTAAEKSKKITLKDERVVQLQTDLKKKPLASSRIVGILANADSMTERAENRLLKTLEEPPGRDVLILLCENKELLLPTILSRCQVMKVTREEEETGSGVQREFAKTYLKLLSEGKGYYAFLPVLREVTEDKPTADGFLDALEELVRERFLAGADSFRREDAERVGALIYGIEEAKKDLNRNCSVGYTLKDLTVKLIY